ncbi:tetratricopeptide repeat protein [Planctomycetaceae bacterium SH139]
MFSFWRKYQLQRQLRRQAAATSRGPTGGSVWLAPFRWLAKLPLAIGRSFGLSVKTWADHLARQRRQWRDLLLGIPAILLLVGFVAATAMGHVKQTGSGLQYWRAGEQQLAKGEAEIAQIFLQKAMMGENVSQRDVMFSLARAYEANEQFDRADVLMSSLAGVGTVGLPAAHRYLAIRTAEKVTKTKQVESLESWFWHLSHADRPKSAPIQKSWGTYYLVGGELEDAITHFRTAAEEEPAMWLQVAELQARMNDAEGVRASLATAQRTLEQQFLRDPADSENRLLYATSLFYIGALPDAEKLLKEGLLNEDNASFRQLLAAVFTRMYDVEASTPDGVAKAFRYLRMSLDYEPNYQPALTRLVTFARSSPERLNASRDAMRQMISTGNSSAMAHFTLGTIEWIAGNQQLAMLNMQQAIELDSRMPIIANNLAYLMSQEENPDLEAALNLVNQAVESDAANAEFRDTRGEIYEKMGQLAKAAADYQQALATTKNKRPLQEKLARLYDQLGDPAMAQEFRDQAAGVETAPQE